VHLVQVDVIGAEAAEAVLGGLNDPPASRAAWMTRTDSSWSGLPPAPNIIAPRAISLTEMPVAPRILRSIVLPFAEPTPGKSATGCIR
jgi:hypothetical protein